MKYFTPLIPFLFGWVLLLTSESFSSISLSNGLLQLLLFALVVCIPAWRTGRMSYVDIAWPWGLVLIGVLVLLLSEGHGLRTLLVSAVYLLMGGRMGILAVLGWRAGGLDKELPRYKYQRRRWEKSGKTHTNLVMQVEVLAQGFANASFLAMPAFIIANNDNPDISFLEIAGLLVWLGAFVLETLADVQKRAFLVAKKAAGEQRQVCNVGLWKYSRHPNYFSQWMVWNALLIAAIPSWLALYQIESLAIWGLLGAALLYTSFVMYTTLVYATGAVPSEYYSVQKRPQYKAYQATTNRFFPGPRKQQAG